MSELSTDSTTHFQPSNRVIAAIVGAMLLVLVPLIYSSDTLAVGGKRHHVNHSATATTAPTTATTVPRSAIRVQVANGTAKKGLARFYSQQLAAQGWNMQLYVNGPHISHTIIYYRDGYIDAATTVQQFLHSGALIPMPQSPPVAGAAGSNVLVLLGPDLAN
jgi:hypothetical protein